MNQIMDVENVSNSTFQYIDCESQEDIFTKHLTFFVVHSVVTDLIPAIISSVFVFRFYQSIEISHPLYAIIFMNIVVSTISSYLSFILLLINTFVNQCALSLIYYSINTTCVFNNIFSFLIIAFIRYYLLIYSKKDSEEPNIDFAKVRNISIAINSGFLVCVLFTRGVLHAVMIMGQPKAQIGFSVSSAVFVVIPLVISLIMNCKIDRELNTKQEKANSLEVHEEVGPDQNQQPIASTSTIQHNNKKPKVFPSVIQNPGAENEKYGGIYIGEPVFDSPIPASRYETDNSTSIEQVVTLPNQVGIEEESEANNVTVVVTVIPSSLKDEVPNANSNKNTPKIRSIRSLNLESHHEAIDVDAESIIVVPPSNEAFPFEIEDDIDEKNQDYKDSKEHKAIMKSVVISAAYLFSIALPFIFVHAAHFNQRVIFVFIAILVSFLKIFRTFAITLASIYCFELIRTLFSTIVNDIIEFHRDIYDRIRIFL